jgi:predicted nucleotidyltransferase
MGTRDGLAGDVVSSRARLDHLLRRAAEVLPSLPGFRTLSLFGSLAEGRADGYSDIDAIVTTDDLDAAREQLLGVLEEVGPVEFCWVLPLRPDEWNPMIAFAAEGYYHRLELGLVASGARNRTIPEEQTTLLVAQPVPRRAAHQTTQAYIPAHGSVGHYLLGDVLGGGIKYVTARKRGQSVVCYRYAVAAADRCLSAWYSELTGSDRLGARLATEEYKRLHSLLTPAQSAAALAALDLSTPAAMDRAVRGILAQVTQHCEAIAKARGEALPTEALARMLRFVERELAGDATCAPPASTAQDHPPPAAS